MVIPKNFIDKLSNHLQKNNQLEKIIDQLQINYGLIACIGVEIEFYLSKNIDVTEFEKLLAIKVKKEKGPNQFEIDLPPSTNIIDYIEQINNTKYKMLIIAEKLQGSIDFSAKPLPNNYGNAMHFHVSFLGNMISQLEFCQNICHYMLDSFLVFTPYPQDYCRFDKDFMAPTNVSFGNNNRTVAVRIPDLYPKRFEHRIANPLTNPYIAVFTILNSIFLGLEFPNKITNLIKTYGNAFDQQYHLTSLPKSLDEALKLFKLEFFIADIVDLHDSTILRQATTIESLLEIMKKL